MLKHINYIFIILITICLNACDSTENTAEEPKSSREKLKIGVITFLSGPAAGPFGVPAQHASDLLVDALNEGNIIPGYNKIGFGGKELEIVYVDEAGGPTKVVNEFRTLVNRQKVDMIIGVISSGDCLAVAPVAEELKTLTVLFDCFFISVVCLFR